jgi:LDH2 family malate/lactate/ureidoglycolate dehydrogenase
MPNATGRPGSKGHFFVGINPENYGDPEGFRSAVTKYIGEVKASRKIPGKEIRIPGEYEFSMRAERLRLGKLPVFEAIWEQARELANRLGVTMAE